MTVLAVTLDPWHLCACKETYRCIFLGRESLCRLESGGRCNTLKIYAKCNPLHKNSQLLGVVIKGGFFSADWNWIQEVVRPGLSRQGNESMLIRDLSLSCSLPAKAITPSCSPDYTQSPSWQRISSSHFDVHRFLADIESDDYFLFLSVV